MHFPDKLDFGRLKRGCTYAATLLVAMRPGKMAGDLLEVVPCRHKNVGMKEPEVGGIVRLQVIVHASLERKISASIVLKSSKQKIAVPVVADILNPIIYDRLLRLEHRQAASPGTGGGHCVVRLIDPIPDDVFPHPEFIRIHLLSSPTVARGRPGEIWGGRAAARPAPSKTSSMAAAGLALVPTPHNFRADGCGSSGVLPVKAGGAAGPIIATAPDLSRFIERDDEDDSLGHMEAKRTAFRDSTATTSLGNSNGGEAVPLVSLPASRARPLGFEGDGDDEGAGIDLGSGAAKAAVSTTGDGDAVPILDVTRSRWICPEDPGLLAAVGGEDGAAESATDLRYTSAADFVLPERLRTQWPKAAVYYESLGKQIGLADSQIDASYHMAVGLQGRAVIGLLAR